MNNTTTFAANGQNWGVRWNDEGSQVYVLRRGGDAAWPSDEQVSAALGHKVTYFAESFHPAERLPARIYDAE